MDRASRRRFEREFAKMPKGDNCSLCGHPFDHNSRTYGGLTSGGAIALTGECCAATLSAVLVQGVYASRNFGEFAQMKPNPSKGQSSSGEVENALGKIQSHFSALDEISSKYATRAGLPGRATEVNTTDSSWKADDAAWFKANASRSHRMRPLADEEAVTLPPSIKNIEIPDRHRLEILVRQVEPGVRARTIFCRNMDFELPDSEEIVHALFDLAVQRGRESRILGADEVAMLARSYHAKQFEKPN